jgi:hypothetical protein
MNYILVNRLKYKQKIKNCEKRYKTNQQKRRMNKEKYRKEKISILLLI